LGAHRGEKLLGGRAAAEKLVCTLLLGIGSDLLSLDVGLGDDRLSLFVRVRTWSVAVASRRVWSSVVARSVCASARSRSAS
jgi:hypothetical protein